MLPAARTTSSAWLAVASPLRGVVAFAVWPWRTKRETSKGGIERRGLPRSYTRARSLKSMFWVLYHEDLRQPPDDQKATREQGRTDRAGFLMVPWYDCSNARKHTSTSKRASPKKSALRGRANCKAASTAIAYPHDKHAAVDVASSLLRPLPRLVDPHHAHLRKGRQVMGVVADVAPR